MAALGILVFLIIADRSIPTFATLYGWGIFKFSTKEDVENFEKRYGLVRFPRTLFALISVISFSSNEWFGVNVDLSLSLGCISLSAWMVAAVFDVVRARK